MHVSGHGMEERGHPDHDADERIAHIYSPLGAALREVPACVAGDICAITKSGSAETGDTISAKDNPLLDRAVGDARAAAAGGDRGQDPRRRGRPGEEPGQARRRRPDHAPGAQRRDPPAGAVVHGRGARRRGARPAARRRRRAGHRAGPGRAAGDLRRRVQGPRPARQAVRRPRPVRRLRHRGRAAAPRRRLRVRRQGGRRRGAAQLHPVGGEGRPRADGARHRRRLPGGRPAGHARSTARRTASTPPTRPSRPPARWP